MKAPIIRFVFLLVATCISFGCRFPFTDDDKPAAAKEALLILSIGRAGGTDCAARTIVPGTSGLVVKYSVLMQKGAESRTVTSAISPIIVPGLERGTWNITVSGLGASDKLLAQGSTTVTVGTDQTVTATITLSFFQSGGTGAVNLTLTFPRSVGVDAVDATLAGGAVAPSLSIIPVDAATDKVVLSQTGIAAGSPLLRVFFKKAGTVLAGVVESVWVFRNVTTTATMNLQEGDFGSPPAAPTGLSVTGQNGGALLLSWTGNSIITDAYVARRSTAPGGPFAQVGSDLAFNATGFRDSGLPADTPYYYQVTAKNRFGESPAASAHATTFPVVAAPTFAPAPGTYGESQTVTISSGTGGTTIYYTIDGSTPSASSTLSIQYAAPIPLSGHGSSLALKAIAVAAGMTDSNVAPAGYTINRKPIITGFTASPASVYRGQSVTITTTAADPEGGALTYTYSSPPEITINGSGAIVTANPTSVGTKTITVTVTDDFGNKTTAPLDLIVQNRPPVISFTIPANLGTMWNNGADQQALSFMAGDPEGDTPLAYAYSVTSGSDTGSVSGSGSTATFTSGTSAGMSTVHVVVTDSQGGAASLDVPLKVCGWRKLANNGGVPAARVSPTAVIDGNGNVILIGGHDPGTGSNLFNDVWEYNVPTQTWTMLRDNLPASATNPSARTWHTAVYDSLSGCVILYGGYDGSASLADLWQYFPAGNTWAQKSITGAGALSGVSAVSDGAGHMLILQPFISGNFCYTLTTSPTWSWSGRTVLAIGRYFYGAVYDSSSSREVVFGGQNALSGPTVFTNGVYKDTVTTAAWTTLNSGGADTTNTIYPSRRSGQSAIYDGAGNMVIFGGNSGGTTAMNDVWQISTAGTAIRAWTKLSSFNPPSGRYYHKAVYYYDASLGKTMLVFGTLTAGDSVVWQYVLP